MFNGYRRLPALTSLAMLGLLAASPAAMPPARPGACSELHRLYSPRLLRAFRMRLLEEYARAHQRRAGVALELLLRGRSFNPMVQMERIEITTQESDEPRMKHLLAYVAMNCL